MGIGDTPQQAKMQSGYPLALLATFVHRKFVVCNSVEIDQAANERLAQLMPQMAKAAEITKQLKTTDQMQWVGLMNIAKAQVEEIIFAEFIYC